MYVQQFSKEFHLDALKTIMVCREMSAHLSEYLPSLAFCAMERGEVIAYAALRQVEGDMAILDGLMTHPDADAGMRDAALDLAVKALLEHADRQGIRAVLAWSTDSHTLIRSEKHGFVRLPQTLIYRVANQG